MDLGSGWRSLYVIGDHGDFQPSAGRKTADKIAYDITIFAGGTAGEAIDWLAKAS
jgi:hypothetical protein